MRQTEGTAMTQRTGRDSLSALHVLAVQVFLAAVSTAAARAAVTFETPRFRLTLSEAGLWTSLVDKASGRELCAAANVPFAAGVAEGKEYAVAAVSLSERKLLLKFKNGTGLTYAVTPEADWIRFRLESVSGPRFQRVDLMRVPVAITEKVGPRLNIAWDDRHCVCLMAATRQADCGARRQKDYALLRASTQDAPGPKMEGASVALIVSPTNEFRTIARRAAHAFGLLTNEDAKGTPSKETELARGSYWFLGGVGVKDVEHTLDYCRRSGFKQVMLSSGVWCRSVGHYLFNTNTCPEEEKSLKEIVDRLHRAGILVGMHCFASKVSKTDPYVTPVPDRRFWVDLDSTLVSDVPAEAAEIRCTTDLREWAGSPVAKQKVWEGGVVKHQEVLLEDEIVQYQSIGPEGRYDTFFGCKRGAWGTKASAHTAGTRARHYGVDGCINGYIVDQETDLLQETTDRLARIFNECGFDMVYFDGGEDVDKRRFSYYVSNFQEVTMRKFKKRPIIHMGTIMTHLLWHSFTRSATVDVYLGTLYGAIQAGQPIEKWPTVKEHIDRSVAYMKSVGEDMMPGELGWFGLWPKGRDTNGLQLDEIEYLMCKSLAYDAPISLQTSFQQMEAHVLTPEILNIVRRYEELRMSRAVPPEVRRQLEAPQKDFALIQQGKQFEFVGVDPVPLVGGTHDVRAFVGACGEGSVATMWHYLREGTVTLDLDPRKVRAADFAGKTVPLTRKEGQVVLPVGSTRLTVFFDGMKPEAVREALSQAKVELRKAAMVFVKASDAVRLEGEMAFGSKVGVQEPEALGDVVLCTARPDREYPKEWFAEYRVVLPHKARWYLWARVRYPSGVDDSFALVLPGQKATLTADQVLGNCGVTEKKWHWTGRGGGTASVPPGEPIPFNLDKGVFTFRVYAREGAGTLALNPRLNCLCLTDESAPPTDEEARKVLVP